MMMASSLLQPLCFMITYLKTKWIKANDSLNEFVELIRQYDTWDWEKNELIKAKQLNDLFSLLSLDEFEGRMIERLKNEETFSFNEFEQQILKMEEEKINRYIRKKNRELVQTFISDHCVGIVHAEMYHSELGNELGKENSHLDYIAILNMGGKKVVSVPFMIILMFLQLQVDLVGEDMPKLQDAP